MNPPRCTDLDYINFLIAAQKAFTCTEAARCQPDKPSAPAHDAFTHLLKRQPPDTGASGEKPKGGSTKNESFRGMLAEAEERGFKPGGVLFDSWYSSLRNLKLLRSLGWRWLTRLKANRLVDPDGGGHVAVRDLEIPAEGLVVHLKGYGMVKVFRTFSRDGEAEHWATSDLDMGVEEREGLSLRGWGIEEYHRGVKQCCGVERAQVRGAVAQLNHIACSIRAFIRLEVNRLKTGVSWYEAKLSIVRDAIRTYLVNPIFTLTPTA